MQGDDLAQELPGLWRFASQRPDQDAAVDVNGSTVTFGGLCSRVNQISHGLKWSGVAPGQTVAALTRNRLDFVAIALAASQVGACFTPVNRHLNTPEVAYILRDSGAVVVFTDQYTAPMVLELQEVGYQRDLFMICLDEHPACLALDDWASNFSTAQPEDRLSGGVMLYTSGTSGRPKGVKPLTRPAAPEVALQRLGGILRRFDLEPCDHIGTGVHLVTSPLYHAAPMWSTLLALHMGHKVIVMPSFDAEASLRLIESQRVTWTTVVPTMMKRWLDLDRDIRGSIDVSSLQWLIHGAAPCPIEVKRRVLEWMGPVVYEYYSSTEVSGTSIGPTEWTAHPGSVGHVRSDSHVRVLDEDGVDVPAGDIGQIYIKGRRRFRYHKDPEKTAASRHEGYVTVGDYGSIDSDGYLYIADRRTDLIISGGVNIYPAEIEAALLSHPGVADAAVIGVPDPDLSQVVHAVIEPKHDVDEEDLVVSVHKYCADRLSTQKQPRTIEVRHELPRTASGKMLRRVLKDEYDAAAAVWP